MGRGDMKSLMRADGVQVVAVCDVVEQRRKEAKDIVDGNYKNKDCATYGDFREVLRRKVSSVPGFAGALRQAELDYAEERDRWAAETGESERVREYFEDREGIGGTVCGGMKCLHAHLAHFLAGGNNPVGAEVHKKLLGLQESDCAGDCGPFLREERRG